MGQLFNVAFKIRGIEEIHYDVVYSEDVQDARDYFLLTSQDCEIIEIAPTFQGFKWQAKSKKYIGRVDYSWMRQCWEWDILDKKTKLRVVDGCSGSEIACIEAVIKFLNEGDFEII